MAKFKAIIICVPTPFILFENNYENKIKLNLILEFEILKFTLGLRSLQISQKKAKKMCSLFRLLIAILR